MPAIIANCCLRQFISTRCKQLVDARGVSRIVSRINSSNVQVRTVMQSDSENIFKWRNHQSIRDVSRNSELIDWENHQVWFKSLLNDLNRFLLIGEIDGEPIGVVRFDNVNSQAEVSIYLVPELKNSVHGYDLLKRAEQWLVYNHPEVKSVFAKVIGGNERSQRLFLSAGYQLEVTSYFKRL